MEILQSWTKPLKCSSLCFGHRHPVLGTLGYILSLRHPKLCTLGQLKTNSPLSPYAVCSVNYQLTGCKGICKLEQLECLHSKDTTHPILCSAPSHYLNQCWLIVNWTLRNNIQWNFNRNTKLFIHEKLFEDIVYEMAAIISRGRWVKVHEHPFLSPWTTHNKPSTVETLYNTINFCWSTHKRHSIARPKGRGMGCLLWVQRATYCVDLSLLSSMKYLL